MVSAASLKWFVIINSSVLLLGTGQYFLLQAAQHHVLAILVASLVKNYMSYALVKTLTTRRTYITQGTRHQTFNLVNFVKSSAIESCSYYYATQVAAYPTTGFVTDIVWFIPMSFLFELVFDFFHYWTHRIVHMYPALYKAVHYKHHEHKLVDTNTTYNHTALDLTLTNFVPIVLATTIVPLSDYSTIMVFWFKSVVEVAGHSGKDTSSSFIQCIWLPRMFGIELYSRNHNLHHINAKYNFSKRFSIWDKLFGTYHTGVLNERHV
jgi:sterol desaturase/sphingolipid hydroxylase (fatty acid hydroxylase superfamily)